MTKYIPTDEQRAAFKADHSTREVKRSIVNLISTGKGIDRALVRHYVSHDVDTTKQNDTVGVFFLEIFAGGKTARGYAEIAFNLVNGVPVAADFRDFRQTITA